MIDSSTGWLHDIIREFLKAMPPQMDSWTPTWRSNELKQQTEASVIWEKRNTTQNVHKSKWIKCIKASSKCIKQIHSIDWSRIWLFKHLQFRVVSVFFQKREEYHMCKCSGVIKQHNEPAGIIHTQSNTLQCRYKPKHNTNMFKEHSANVPIKVKICYFWMFSKHS